MSFGSLSLHRISPQENICELSDELIGSKDNWFSLLSTQKPS